MAIGITSKQYAAETGAITGKKLRAVSQAEVDKFNDDLMNMAVMYGMDSIRAAVEEYQEQIFVLVRQVMEQANAPYGGAGARGAEICMSALRPIDVSIAADIWDVDNTAVDVLTMADRDIIKVNACEMGEEEGNILFGALVETGSRRVVNAFKWSKNQVDYPTLTLPFPYVDGDRATFVKFQAPIIQFTEEILTLTVNIVRAEWDYTALVGVHACRARHKANTYS